MYSLNLILFLFCCLWATGAEANGQWNKYTYVNPSNGSNTTDCGTLTCPCRNLSYALQGGFREPATMFVLSPGTHYLDNTTYCSPFTLSGLGMRGSASVVECVGPNAGLSFIGASNITLEGITFSHCAALQNSTSRNFSVPLDTLEMYQFYVGLYFYLCENVSMDGIVVTNSLNATGVVMFDTTGNITITQSNFTNNKVDSSSGNKYPGGGGFYIEFTYCTPGDSNCTRRPTSHNFNSSYTFKGCIFSKNFNSYILGEYYTFFTLPHGTFHDAFGRGGGMSIFFKGSATNNAFEISHCQFIDNKAIYGGGLAIRSLDDAMKNTVKIENCFFVSNWCEDRGGGVSMFYVVTESVEGSNNATLLSGNFTNNTAKSGGAFSLLVTSQGSTTTQVRLLSVHNSTFNGNQATVGAAAYFARYLLLFTGGLPAVEISESNFTKNQLVRSDSHKIYREGIGTLYVNKVPVQFRQSVCFVGNEGSALAVIGTHVDFKNCSANFTNNTGYQGGAIALLGAAWILFNGTTSMSFIRNLAVTKGGAIYNKYIEKEDLRDFSECFLNYDDPYTLPKDWNATFLFWNNSAGFKHGKTIYSTSIFPCSRGNDGDLTPSNARHIFCWKNWTWKGSSCESEIGTDAGNITLSNRLPVKAFPGKVFYIPIDVHDDLNHNISNETVFAATAGNTSSAMVDSEFLYVSHGSIRMLGSGNSRLEVDTVSNRAWHIDIEVELQPCPPGFIPSTTSKSAFCTCSGDYGGRIECDNASFTARLTSGYWIGCISRDPQCVLVISPCHSGYCSTTSDGSASLLLPNSSAKHILDARICGQQNRTGVMCGECLEGNGPTVNSDAHQCVYCRDINTTASIIYYVVSIYVPLFVLFVFIIMFNVRLTTGPANAFILYSQAIASTFGADGGSYNHFHIPSSRMIQGYKIPYGVFNLEFFENLLHPLCLGTGLNALDILQLDYFVALFPLLMIVLVLLFVRIKQFVGSTRLCGFCNSTYVKHVTCFRFQRWRLGESLLHAFAAFILLSYTKFTLISTYILSTQAVISENGSSIGLSRAFFAGQFTTNVSIYKFRYFLPSVIVFATFVAIPPLLLLHYPVKLLENCINRVHCLRRLYPTAKVHILLDTFQGCYKNNMRFFAGLYFVLRLALSASYALSSRLLSQYCYQQIICTSYILLVALFQPYTRKFLNYIDILIFTNLAIINALSAYLYPSPLKEQHPKLAAIIIQYILIFLPLVYMVVYVVWCLTSPCHGKIKMYLRTRKEMTSSLIGERENSDEKHKVSTTDIADIDREINEAPPDETEALLWRAQRGNLYRTPQQQQRAQEEEGRAAPMVPDVELQHPAAMMAGEEEAESEPLLSHDQGEGTSYGTLEGANN